MAKKPKFYVVWHGHQPGIYTSWPEAKAQIDGFAGARYKSYPTRAEAESALRSGAPAIKRGTCAKSRTKKPINC